MFMFQRNGIYYIEYFDEQEQKIKRISTGKRDKSEAQFFYNSFDPSSIKKTYRPEKSLSDFLDEYYSVCEHSFTPNYLRSIRLASKMFINTIGNKNIKQITPRDIELFVSKTFSRANYAAHLYYRTLKAAFNKAIVWEYIDSNPFNKVKPAKTQKKIPAFLSVKELDLIIENEKDDRLKDLYTVAFYTGLRLSEILNLQWTNINFERILIIVGNTCDFLTKGKVARVIPMSNKIYVMLKRKHLYSFSKHVFVDLRGRKFNNDFVSKRFKIAVRKSKLPDSIHFHTLRHSFASSLAQKGVSLYVIKEILGHQDISTTQIYAHLNNNSLFEAVNRLDD